MVKEAHSFELTKSIAADKARSMAFHGKLLDKRKFICADPECQVPLTCTNWTNKNPIRTYFKLSDNSKPHIAGCKKSGENEETQRAIFENEAAKTTVQKNGLVILKKIADQKKTSPNTDQKNNQGNNLTSGHLKSNLSSTNNKKSLEGSYLTSILSAITLYQDPNFDNDKKVLRVSKNVKLSLNDFFVSVDKTTTIPKNELRIYYGKVKLKSILKDKSIMMITFCDSNKKPDLFTNKNLMLSKFYGKHAVNYLDKNKVLYVFFRGFLNDKNKWEAYNGENYKDLYFSLKEL